MSNKQYSFDEAQVQITTPEGDKIAIFDVSPTIYCRWIAITSKSWDLLYVFEDTMDMLEFVAHKQDQGATIPNEDKWLDEQVSGNGYDSWAEYVNEICAKESAEFPVYYDAQGREHAEF
jgi:hypothetical protein